MFVIDAPKNYFNFFFFFFFAFQYFIPNLHNMFTVKLAHCCLFISILSGYLVFTHIQNGLKAPKAMKLLMKIKQPHEHLA